MFAYDVVSVYCACAFLYAKINAYYAGAGDVVRGGGARNGGVEDSLGCGDGQVHGAMGGRKGRKKSEAGVVSLDSVFRLLTEGILGILSIDLLEYVLCRVFITYLHTALTMY